jgi:hypothetical protein
VFAALADPCLEIRVHSLGLVGELAKSCCGLVQQHLTQVLTTIHSALTIEQPRVAGQAAWALSQITLNQVSIAGLETMQQAHVDAFVNSLCTIMMAPADAEARNCKEQAALCLGQLVYVDSMAPARHQQAMIAVAGRFVEIVRNVRNLPLKYSALTGMLPVLMACGASVLPSVHHLVDLALSVVDTPSHREMSEFLKAFRQAQGGNWDTSMRQQCKPEVATRLYQKYGVR